MIVAAYTPGVTHRCLICENELEAQSGQPVWPWGATVARIDGMYGSSVYDPAPSRAGLEYLEAFICDSCLVAKAKSGLIAQVHKLPRPPEFEKKPWNPDE